MNATTKTVVRRELLPEVNEMFKLFQSIPPEGKSRVTAYMEGYIARMNDEPSGERPRTAARA